MSSQASISKKATTGRHETEIKMINMHMVPHVMSINGEILAKFIFFPADTEQEVNHLLSSYFFNFLEFH